MSHTQKHLVWSYDVELLGLRSLDSETPVGLHLVVHGGQYAAVPVVEFEVLILQNTCYYSCYYNNCYFGLGAIPSYTQRLHLAPHSRISSGGLGNSME